MTTMPLGAPNLSLNLNRADGVRQRSLAPTPTALRVACVVEWPCLARAIDPEAAATAECLIRVRVLVEGPTNALRGSCTIESIAGTLSRTLLELPVRGALAACDHWRVVSITGDAGSAGPLALDAVVPAESDGQRCDPMSGPWHVRATVMRVLGVAGGRYGCPSLSHAVTATGPAADA